MLMHVVIAYFRQFVNEDIEILYHGSQTLDSSQISYSITLMWFLCSKVRNVEGISVEHSNTL